MINIGFVLKAIAGALGAFAASLPVLPSPLAEAAAAPDVVIRVPQSALPRSTHWERTSQAIATSIECTQRMHDLNVEAARQLDAVDYAYTRMLDELTAVMPGLTAIRTDNPGLAVSAPVASLTSEPVSRQGLRRPIDQAA